ncbi:MAG TPA: site-specific integrase [bacterium]|nr:site-specific integrase [bacterium]HPG44932.1 site-specific integrase [bacterium]HPM98039.1 site-specific integrase [bacterium]
MAKIYERDYKNRITYYAHFSVRGKRYRIRLDAQNRAQAKKLAADAEYQILTEHFEILKKTKKMKLCEVADQYIEFAKSNKRSWDRDIVSLRNILHMEIDGRKLGQCDIDSIKVSDIQKYQIRRKRELDEKFDRKGIAEEDRNYATINRELACLKHIYYLAIEWEFTLKNPVVSKAIKFYKERERKRTLSDAEYSMLVSSATGHLRLILLIALNTGMRLGEILSLGWNDIDFTGRKFYITHTKTDEDREVPINSFLFDILINVNKDSEFLFINRDGKPIKSIKTTWHSLLRRLAIDNLHFHDLRHTAATRMARAKVTESVIAMILGHKRASITSRYINPHWEEMVDAAEILGRICHEFVTKAEYEGIGPGHSALFNNKIKDVI